MTHTFGFMIESMVATLLLLTILYCVRLSKQLRLLRARAEQHPVEPFEVTIDFRLAHGTLDEVDGGCVASGRESRAVGSEELLQFHETVVQHRGQVRGCTAGFARADFEGVDDLNVQPFTAQ